jgi:LmbE family N-acetylglucosaminyl deacetylase
VTGAAGQLEIDSALVVVAHPDDCEFLCGGTVAGWTAASASVTLVVATDGAKGSHDPSLPDADLAETRRAEQREGAAVLGIGEVRFLDAPDGGLERTGAIVLEVVRTIRSSRPDVVVGFDPWRLYELHPDHRAAGWIACDAVFRAKEPRLDQDLAATGLPPWRPQELWLLAPQEPNHVEDVSDRLETKLRAMLCHRSQYATSMGISLEDPGSAARFEERLRANAAAVGEPAGFRYGEPFRRIEL